MTDIFDSLMGQLGGDKLKSLAGALGTDESTATKGIQSAIPAILGGLASNAAKPKGAAALSGALERDHDGSVFDNLGDILGGGGAGGKILGHVFGGAKQQDNVARAVSSHSGLDLGMITKLLPMLAPLVLGQLGKMKKEQNLDTGGLAGALAKEKGGLGGLGGLGSLLDLAGGKGGLGGLLKKLMGR